MDREQAVKSAKMVLESTVGDHIVSLRGVSKSTAESRNQARKALRNWIGTQEETTFGQVDDFGKLLVLLEEFFAFGMFMAVESRNEGEGQLFDLEIRRLSDVLAKQKPGQA